MTPIDNHIIRSMDIFEDLKDDELGQIASLMHPMRLAEGEVFMKRGDPAQTFYVVVSGNYMISLQVLKNIKKIDKNIKSKSGFMVGLGENKEQIMRTMLDLRESDVDLLTIGQYLQPTRNHAKIKKYYTPKEFDEFKEIAIDLGFKHVESGPLVRSSYHAEEAIF